MKFGNEHESMAKRICHILYYKIAFSSRRKKSQPKRKYIKKNIVKSYAIVNPNIVRNFANEPNREEKIHSFRYLDFPLYISSFFAAAVAAAARLTR